MEKKIAIDKGLVSAYLLNGQGGGKKIGWKEVKEWRPEDGLIWIHLDYSYQETQNWLYNESGLERLIVDGLISPANRPRVFETDEGLNIYLRGVNLNPGSEPEDMVSIRVWVEDKRIITTRKRFILSIDDIRTAIANGKGPKTASNFVVMLVDCLVNRMADYLTSLSERVDELEESVLTADSHTLRPIIADARREVIALRRYLAPQRDALVRIQAQHSKWLDEDDWEQLREASDRVLRYIEDLDSARDRAAVTQEELTSRLSDQLNHRMYILSVVAVIFLPLSFITGLLGVNLAGIPGSTQDWAFSIATVGLVFLALVLVLLFKRKKWM